MIYIVCVLLFQGTSKNESAISHGGLVTWVAWVRKLPGYMGYVCRIFYVSYVGQNIFYMNQHFEVVKLFTWVSGPNIYLSGFICVGQTFLRESKILLGSIYFPRVNLFCVGSKYFALVIFFLFCLGPKFLAWVIFFLVWV